MFGGGGGSRTPVQKSGRVGSTSVSAVSGFAAGSPGGGLAGGYPVRMSLGLYGSGASVIPLHDAPSPVAGPPGRDGPLKRPEPTRCRRLLVFPLVNEARVPGSLPRRPPIPVEAVSPPGFQSPLRFSTTIVTPAADFAMRRCV